MPFEFNTIGVDDGIAMGHVGMKYSLASRELIADCVETMLRAHCFDGVVCIPNCDKIVPGMMMAAARVNIPAIFVSGGPMKAGKTSHRRSRRSGDACLKAWAKFSAGKMTEAELTDIEQHACPTCGSCSGMFTANSMNCLCEALGLALPGNGSILATDPKGAIELFREAGQAIVESGEEEHSAQRYPHAQAAFENAFALDVAMGGSTNTVLHTLAIAIEAGRPFPLAHLNEVSARVPYVCKVAPAGKYHMEDVDRAGGNQRDSKTIGREAGDAESGLHHRDRQNARRKYWRRGGERHGCDSAAGKRLQRDGRAGGAVWQSRAEWIGAEDRRGAPEHAQIQRAGGDL